MQPVSERPFYQKICFTLPALCALTALCTSVAFEALNTKQVYMGNRTLDISPSVVSLIFLCSGMMLDTALRVAKLNSLSSKDLGKLNYLIFESMKITLVGLCILLATSEFESGQVKVGSIYTALASIPIAANYLLLEHSPLQSIWRNTQRVLLAGMVGSFAGHSLRAYGEGSQVSDTVAAIQANCTEWIKADRLRVFNTENCLLPAEEGDISSFGLPSTFPQFKFYGGGSPACIGCLFSKQPYGSIESISISPEKVGKGLFTSLSKISNLTDAQRNIANVFYGAENEIKAPIVLSISYSNESTQLLGYTVTVDGEGVFSHGLSNPCKNRLKSPELDCLSDRALEYFRSYWEMMSYN